MTSSRPVATTACGIACLLHAGLFAVVWLLLPASPTLLSVLQFLFWPWILWLIAVLPGEAKASVARELAVFLGTLWCVLALPMALALVVSTFGMGC
ncbi:hypothetical protein [Ramlibacter sp.]|uniref:hypothetical protein n=1 Tax=Ramlibacter sp. TaxID=1917967 RepID=UPI00261B3A5A|nr:hypothetical protein [Ramlibacter sp.]